MSATADEATLRRFWAKVNKTDSCWLWTGATRWGGYGVFHNGVLVPAHRLSYELARGPIPNGLVLDHLCRVTSCVNPAHLEPVTHRENILRGVRKDKCHRGHPYSFENKHVSKSGRWRCRKCEADGARHRRRLRKLAGAA